MADPSPLNVESLLRISADAQRRGDFDKMLEAADRAAQLGDGDAQAIFRLLECALYCGQVDRVRSLLAEIEASASTDHRLLGQTAEYYTHCADHESAYRCYRRAVELQPENTGYLFALSAAEIARGNLEVAEQLLNDVIELDPHDYDAYRNRAMLRKQTQSDNHIDEISKRLDAGVRTPAGEAQLCYALAKEYEDLCDFDISFDFLSRGATRRRSLMNYRVEGDVAVMQRLREVFDEDRLTQSFGCDESGPVFVIGLPRSGTTLVDRILSSHSAVDSLGEINNFAYALMHTIGRAGDKLHLVEYSAEIDFSVLGRRYVNAVRSYGRTAPWLIDKTPLNYLYIGLIKLAIPNARIVHIRRNPMDSCYGMYRTLFRAGYPFSYSLDDLGRYYVAYRGLMDHWNDVAGDAYLDIEYETLVDDQEAVSRQVIEYCGLDWEAACLEFHRNSSAVLTASSAQVRRPVYRDAVQRWRHYEKELAPLHEYLVRHGIDIDAG